MGLVEYVDVSVPVMAVAAIDFIIAVAILVVLGKMTGLVSDVNSMHELTEKDNVAFGITYASALLAVAIMLTGAISGDPGGSYLHEAFLIGGYGLFGVVLMLLAKHVFDKMALPKIDLHKQIIEGNNAAAIVSAGAVVSTGLILKAAMVWTDSNLISGIVAVAGGFVISQLMLALVTRYRVFVYAKRNGGECIQSAFEGGNSALAIRYVGHQIGAALAITAASYLVDFDSELYFQGVFVWAGIALLMTVAVSLLSIFARHVVLYKVDVSEEVDKQRNTGVALIEAFIYVMNGLLLISLFA